MAAERAAEALLGDRRPVDRRELAASPARPSRCRRPSPASGRRPTSASSFASGAAVAGSKASGRNAPGERGRDRLQGEHRDHGRQGDREQRVSVETQVDHQPGIGPPSNLQPWREDRRGSCSWTMSRPCRRFSPTRSARKGMRWWGQRTGKRPWTASVRSGSISWCSTSCSRSWMGSRSAGAFAPAARCRSSCSPRRGTRSTRSPASRWAPTTTSPSRSRCASSAAGSRPPCAAAGWAASSSPANEPIQRRRPRDRLRAPLGQPARRSRSS